MKKIIYTIFILISGLLANSDTYYRVNSLNGPWRFEIGDNLNWAGPNYDDSNWETIDIKSSWEEEGFPGYDGYAWYRIKIKLNADAPDAMYYLKLGAIDDCDATFVNGHLVGYTGTFPPEYNTAYDANREYIVPNEYLNKGGVNVIAIRVYDGGGQGGIRWGDVGLYIKEPSIKPIVDLSGFWRFHTGDNMAWMDPKYNDSEWKKLIVPSVWETQGYAELNGFAWYRNKFSLESDYKSDNLILLLGKVDDLDETYLNGQLLGKTGVIPENAQNVKTNDWEYKTIRAYYIPRDLLNYNGENTIAVRVYDGPGVGGIWEGPIGIITREQYLKWKNNGFSSDGLEDFFEFLEDIFN